MGRLRSRHPAGLPSPKGRPLWRHMVRLHLTRAQSRTPTSRQRARPLRLGFGARLDPLLRTEARFVCNETVVSLLLLLLLLRRHKRLLPASMATEVKAMGNPRRQGGLPRPRPSCTSNAPQRAPFTSGSTLHRLVMPLRPWPRQEGRPQHGAPVVSGRRRGGRATAAAYAGRDQGSTTARRGLHDVGATARRGRRRGTPGQRHSTLPAAARTALGLTHRRTGRSTNSGCWSTCRGSSSSAHAARKPSKAACGEGGSEPPPRQLWQPAAAPRHPAS